MPVRRFLTLLYMAASLLAMQSHAATFEGAACTKDCSGHKAGYAWARKKGITSPEQCGGRSNSFTEGCKLWAQEHQAPSNAHSAIK